MTCFVTKYAHALRVSATFYLQHLLALEFYQSRMGEIKRNSDAGHAVGRKPLFREPDVRFKANAAIVQFAVETLDVIFEERSLDPDREIADTRVEQSLIRNEAPSESGRHSANCNCDWFERLDALLPGSVGKK